MKVFIILLFFSSGIWAQTYYMNVKTKTGTSSYPIQDIQKLTFILTVDVKDYEKFKDVLNTFTLLQNYPNPFNPTTKIEFNIPQSAQVEVNIFDINGQLVKQLINEFLEKGYHQSIWNAKNESGQVVASGNYIYQVKVDNKTISKKMLFIK